MSEQQTKRDNGGPAFPITGNLQYEGMSLRDYFAAKAMQGMLANRDAWDGERHNDYVATQAYKIADAMIAEGKK
jgi:hypothetical protein